MVVEEARRDRPTMELFHLNRTGTFEKAVNSKIEESRLVWGDSCEEATSTSNDIRNAGIANTSQVLGNVKAVP